MKIERVWAMPNKWTFTIKPIQKLLEQEMKNRFLLYDFWVDPFCGKNSPASITNDLNPNTAADYHLDALEFLSEYRKELSFGNIEGVVGLLKESPKSNNQTKRIFKNLYERNSKFFDDYQDWLKPKKK